MSSITEKKYKETKPFPQINAETALLFIGAVTGKIVIDKIRIFPLGFLIIYLFIYINIILCMIKSTSDS